MFFLPYSQTTVYAPSGYQRLESGSLYAQLNEMKVTGDPAPYQDTFHKVLAEIDPKLALINVETYRPGGSSVQPGTVDCAANESVRGLGACAGFGWTIRRDRL